MGVGLSDSRAEMDRELGKMRGRQGEGGVLDRCRCSEHLSGRATADFQLPAAYVCVVSMCSKPPLSLTGGSQPA